MPDEDYLTQTNKVNYSQHTHGMDIGSFNIGEAQGFFYYPTVE